MISSIAFLVGAFATLDLLWAPFALLLPVGFLAWAAAIIVALRQRKWWWAAASLPFMGVPLAIFGALAEACSRGDCL